MPKKFKGDIWFVSDFFFLITLFFVSLILLFSMSIAKIVVGNFIDFTVHASFLEFSLNNENALLSGTEIKFNPSDPQLKRVLSNAAFQWDGTAKCGTPPCWDGLVYVDGYFHDASALSQKILNTLITGPYVFEMRKQFVGGEKSMVIASRDAAKVEVDPEVAELELQLPFAACGTCNKYASYRLYSTIK